MAGNSHLKNMEGSITQLAAAAQTGKMDGMFDVVRDLRDQIANMLTAHADRLDAEYARLVSDQDIDNQRIDGMRDYAERFRADAISFAPALGDDPERPNPLLQPGGPAQMMEPGEGEADDDDELKGDALRQRANELEIEGRSTMTADEMRAAIADAERTRA